MIRTNWTAEEEAAFWAGLETRSPGWWISTEVHRLRELLQTHVQLALETKTDPARVIKQLKRVRAAILDTREAA